MSRQALERRVEGEGQGINSLCLAQLPALVCKVVVRSDRIAGWYTDGTQKNLRVLEGFPRKQTSRGLQSINAAGWHFCTVVKCWIQSCFSEISSEPPIVSVLFAVCSSIFMLSVALWLVCKTKPTWNRNLLVICILVSQKLELQQCMKWILSSAWNVHDNSCHSPCDRSSPNPTFLKSSRSYKPVLIIKDCSSTVSGERFIYFFLFTAPVAFNEASFW